MLVSVTTDDDAAIDAAYKNLLEHAAEQEAEIARQYAAFLDEVENDLAEITPDEHRAALNRIRAEVGMPPLPPDDQVQETAAALRAYMDTAERAAAGGVEPANAFEARLFEVMRNMGAREVQLPEPPPRPRDTNWSARQEILRRHARLWKSTKRKGAPMVCIPSKEEKRLFRKSPEANDGKIIFDSREAAEAAARELEALGSKPMRSFACPRSKNDHFHLTTDGPRARKEKS